MDEKHFQEWIKLKERLHEINRIPRILEGEVWWCACGENIGVEINGKHEVFSRPVIVMKKLSHFSFMGIPLTSQPKVGSWYVEFDFLKNKEYAALCQARILSVARLYSKIGRLPESDLKNIRDSFVRLYR